MRSKQDALEFNSVGKEDLLNKSPINRRRVRNFFDLPVSFSVHCRIGRLTPAPNYGGSHTLTSCLDLGLTSIVLSTELINQP